MSELTVYYQVWRKPGEPIYRAFHKGSKLTFTRLQDYRDFAEKEGYSGIRLASLNPPLVPKGKSLPAKSLP